MKGSRSLELLEVSSSHFSSGCDGLHSSVFPFAFDRASPPFLFLIEASFKNFSYSSRLESKSR